VKKRRIHDRFPELSGGSEDVTLIGEGVVFEGEVEIAEHLHLAGRVNGSVRAGGVVFVEHGGVVKGQLEGDVLVVEGTVDGKCRAYGQFELGESGRVRGDVECPSVALAEGAFLQGKIRTRGRDPHVFREKRRRR